MKHVQHIHVKLEVTLTVQIPSAEDLKDNIPAYQEPALVAHALQTWERSANKGISPNAVCGVVHMKVERQ